MKDVIYPVQLAIGHAPLMEAIITAVHLSNEKFEEQRTLVEEFVVGRLRVLPEDAPNFVDSLRSFGMNADYPGANFQEAFMAYSQAKRSRNERTSPANGGYKGMLRGQGMRFTYPPLMEGALKAAYFTDAQFETFKYRYASFVSDFFQVTEAEAITMVEELRRTEVDAENPGSVLSGLFSTAVTPRVRKVAKALAEKPGQTVEEIAEQVEPVASPPGVFAWSAPAQDESSEQEVDVEQVSTKKRKK